LRAWPDVIDVVPGMNNLTIVFDALASTAESLTPALRDAWDSADVAPVPGRDVEIPVEYGGAAGPDLAAVAAHTGLSADEVVARHAGGEYVVFFVGFQPGFAYLGGLDPALHTRAAPRRGSRCRPARSASAARKPASIRPRRRAAGS
jgi:KipI family sensor histidine kinase inhibitor